VTRVQERRQRRVEANWLINKHGVPGIRDHLIGGKALARGFRNPVRFPALAAVDRE
jgi:hypothetical protein